MWKLQKYHKSLLYIYFHISIWSILFANNSALGDVSEPAMKQIMSHFKESPLHAGFEVRLKTVVLHQPAPLEVYHHPVIMVCQTELKVIQQFNYLGSMISLHVMMNKEVDNRLAMANNTFGRLYKCVWDKSQRQYQRPRFIKLSYWAPSCTVLSPGSCITITCTSSSICIGSACAPSSKYAGVTSSQTQKSWT